MPNATHQPDTTQESEERTQTGIDIIRRSLAKGRRIEASFVENYYLYASTGHHIGVTTYPGPLYQQDADQVKAHALRMAYSEELLAALRKMLEESIAPAAVIQQAKDAVALATGHAITATIPTNESGAA